MKCPDVRVGTLSAMAYVNENVTCDVTVLLYMRSRGSMFGIRLGYGLDGPGFEPNREMRFFFTSVAALGPFQLPVQ